jgi:hypothetical protein
VKRGMLLLAAIGAVAAVFAAGAESENAKRLTCGGRFAGYSWIGPTEGPSEVRMFARLRLFETSSTPRKCVLHAEAHVGCANPAQTGPVELASSDSARPSLRAKKFTISHARENITETSFSVVAGYVGRLHNKSGLFVGPKALDLTLQASDCWSSHPFSVRVRRDG